MLRRKLVAMFGAMMLSRAEEMPPIPNIVNVQEMLEPPAVQVAPLTARPSSRLTDPLPVSHAVEQVPDVPEAVGSRPSRLPIPVVVSMSPQRSLLAGTVVKSEA